MDGLQAGFSVAAMAVPQGMSYAQNLAFLPQVYGLVSAQLEALVWEGAGRLQWVLAGACVLTQMPLLYLPLAPPAVWMLYTVFILCPVGIQPSAGEFAPAALRAGVLTGGEGGEKGHFNYIYNLNPQPPGCCSFPAAGCGSCGSHISDSWIRPHEHLRQLCIQSQRPSRCPHCCKAAAL